MDFCQMFGKELPRSVYHADGFFSASCFCPGKPFSNNLSRKVPASIQNYDIAFEKEPKVLPNH